MRDCNMELLEEAKAEISEEDFMRAEYVIEEIQRVLDVCDALEKGDYETVGQKMYETDVYKRQAKIEVPPGFSSFSHPINAPRSIISFIGFITSTSVSKYNPQ